MATQVQERGEFSLIITDVDRDQMEAAAQAFSSAFSLDVSIALQIVKSAPIIFAQKLTKNEVKAISPKLQTLSEAGLEFRVTARAAQKLPKVNWPMRPQFTAGGSGGPNGLAFEWDNNAFVCPGCGETFLFRRLGKLKLVEPAARPKETQVARTASAPAPSMDAQMEGVEGAELVGEAETFDFEGTGEGIDLGEVDLSAEPAEAPLEAAPVDEFQVEAIQAPDETAVSDGEMVQEEVEEAPPAAPTGELFNVFLSKITDSSKREKAADLISQVKGCTVAEAKELATRLVIPLAKGVSKDRAEDVLAKFKKLKVFGRMTKVKS